jgi:hypothetical protein
MLLGTHLTSDESLEECKAAWNALLTLLDGCLNLKLAALAYDGLRKLLVFLVNGATATTLAEGKDVFFPTSFKIFSHTSIR